jgi:hypothetical protein
MTDARHGKGVIGRASDYYDFSILAGKIGHVFADGIDSSVV